MNSHVPMSQPQQPSTHTQSCPFPFSLIDIILKQIPDTINIFLKDKISTILIISKKFNNNYSLNIQLVFIFCLCKDSNKGHKWQIMSLLCLF